MLKKLKIFQIFILLFIILFCLNSNPVYATSVFGEGGTSNSEINSNTGQNEITSQAKSAGKDSTKQVAKFKNPEQLNIALDNLFKMFRWGIATITTFGTITSFLIFSLAFFRLSTAPSHPIERRKVMIDIIQSGVATVLLGGLSLIMTVFYKTFSTFINNTIFLTTDFKTAFAMALIDYKFLICGIMGVIALSMFIVFIKDIISLASSGGNPQQRAQAMKGLLTTGIAVIGFGGTGVFVAIFNGLL